MMAAPTIGKSYMSRSEQSLVTVLREDQYHRQRRKSGFHNGERASEAGSEASDFSEDEESEEAELTRLHRFCWAICCCHRCSTSVCCVQDDDQDQDVVDESASMSSVPAVPMAKKAKPLCDCSPMAIWDRIVAIRNCIRDRVEFAEYGNCNGMEDVYLKPFQLDVVGQLFKKGFFI